MTRDELLAKAETVLDAASTAPPDAAHIAILVADGYMKIAALLDDSKKPDAAKPGDVPQVVEEIRNK